MVTGEIKKLGKVYEYSLSYSLNKSPAGIDGGRIDRLTIIRNYVTVAKYDKGWVITPTDETTEEIVKILNWQYNRWK